MRECKLNSERRLGTSVFRAVLLCGTMLGCSSNGDAASRDLFSLSHLSSDPKGVLSVADDGEYRFLAEGAGETRGKLTSAELDSVQRHASGAALQLLYAYDADDANICLEDSAAYILNSNIGAACILLTSISDGEVRAHLDALVVLFNSKSSSR